VQAIEAMRSFEWSVTSLQEHAANLRASTEARDAPERFRHACRLPPERAPPVRSGCGWRRHDGSREAYAWGIDPHPALLAAWDLPDSPGGARAVLPDGPGRPRAGGRRAEAAGGAL
jgi:carbamoyl-phosphate synthase large subunit